MKIVQRCERSVDASKLSASLIELAEFNNESRIFQHFDTIKRLISKNAACSKNMETEGAKILKDFTAYLTQLIRYLEKEHTGLAPESAFTSGLQHPTNINFDSNH